MITVKNAEITSENTEKDTLGCKEIKLQKYIILCLLLPTCTHTTKNFFVTTNFSNQSLESNQNDENCNRKQYSVIEIENIWLAKDMTITLNISSNLKASGIHDVIPLLKRTRLFTF